MRKDLSVFYFSLSLNAVGGPPRKTAISADGRMNLHFFLSPILLLLLTTNLKVRIGRLVLAGGNTDG